MKKITVAGIILLISISPLLRGLFFNLEASVFLTVLALLSVMYFFIKRRNDEALYYNKWMLVFGFVLLAAYALSFIKAVNIRENIESAIQYTQYYIVSIILYDCFHDKKKQFPVAVMFPAVIIGFLCAVIGLEALTGAFDVLQVTLSGNRIGSTFQYANTAAIYFVVCILFILTLVSSTGNMIMRVLLAGIGNTLVFALLLTGSRGGIIIGGITILLFLAFQPLNYKFKGAADFLCIVLPVILYMRKFTAYVGTRDYVQASKWLVMSFCITLATYLIIELFTVYVSGSEIKPFMKITVFVMFIVLFTAFTPILGNKLVYMLPQDIVQRFLTFDLNNGSIVHRLEFDNDALKLIAGNWMFGLGGGGWTSLYQSVQERFYIARAVHNHYFQIFVEVGILGFLAFLSITFVALRNALYSFSKARDAKEKVFIAGFFCSFLSLVLHVAIDFDLSYPSMALLFWMLITACTIYLPHLDSRKILPGNIAIVFIIISSSLASINGLYTASAYNASQARNYMEAKKYAASRAYYEEAHRLDPLNAAYTFELTKLYNYFAKKSKNAGDALKWREKAKITAEKSVSLDPYYPDYIHVLACTYLDSKMPLEGLEAAEKLVKYQPCNSDNYELLARGYLEAASFYADNQNHEKAKELVDLYFKHNLSSSTVFHKFVPID